MRTRGLIIALFSLLLVGIAPAQAIVNGTKVNAANWQFLVAVGCSSSSTAPSCAERKMGADSNGMTAPQFCGGTLIAPQVVVTAAHCIYPKPTEQLTAADLIVGGGTADLAQIKAASTYSTVASVTVHPMYNKTSQVYDVAILTLNRPIDNTAPIAYATKLPRAGDSVEVAGWGEIDNNAKPTAIAYSAAMTVYSDADCATQVGDTFEPTSMQCALGKSGALWLDACHGDSGGPLIGTIDGARVLVGSVSWGARCAEGKPGMYTKLPTMLSEVLTITPTPPKAVDVKKTKPGVPSAKAAKIAKNGSVLVTIAAPTDGQDVDHWTISCTAKGSKFQSTTQAQELMLGGLRRGTVYTCKVNAANGIGTSGWSKTLTLK